MRSGSEQKPSRVVLIVAILVVAAFIILLIGTYIGFNIALESLSGCVPVQCSEIGVDASRCEVCVREGLSRLVG